MDSLCLRTGIPSISMSSGSGGVVAGMPAIVPAGVIAVEKSGGGGGVKTAALRFSLKHQFRSLFPRANQERGIIRVALDDAVLVDGKGSEKSNSGGEIEGGRGSVGKLEQSEGQSGKWMSKILNVKSLWSEQGIVLEEYEKVKGEDGTSSSASRCEDEVDGVCEACDCEYDDDEESGRVFDRNSFSKLLRRVSLSDARLFAQMSYLGNLAYAIPSIKVISVAPVLGTFLAQLSGNISTFGTTLCWRFGLLIPNFRLDNVKPRNLLKRYGLRYVTSSIEKREQLASAEKNEQLVNANSQQPSNEPQEKTNGSLETAKLEIHKSEKPRIDPSAAFHIAASIASHLNARTRHIFGSRKSDLDQEILEDSKGDKEHISEMATSFMTNTDSVTAVVAAKEEVKQAVADDLNSISSTPCEWYICDDDKTATRFFVVQGSETLASWQANLLFEPIHFEGFDTFVHRGIYEAAKGMYQQMLPEIHAHMKAHGRRAKLRFSGHSLGGSLSLLINLMLLIREEVPLSSLLPVITFGSPTIMCGGDKLLQKLGLPRSHIQAVAMHRDIVPRAFSCNYPNHVAELLKAVNRNFRHHPCLNKQKFLYGPMGELLILQPEATYSPSHNLLPSGSGLYIINSSHPDAEVAERLLQEAKLAFLNTPHPLEILRDRTAYGKGGAIQRDHDMNSYLKCVRSVVRHELSQIRKAKRERRRVPWWPLVLPRVISGGGVQLVIRRGSESLRKVSKIVTLKNLHLLVLLLFPARLLLVGAFSFIGGFRLR